ELCLARAHLPGAAKLSAEDFQQRTTELYLAILKAFADSDAPHPVRFWNYLPGIHAPTGSKVDRYMTFNAGRFAAFEQSFGGRDAVSRSIPSASAVGHHGQDLTIHALACATPGRPVANPRQVAPYHYSK